MMNEVLEFIYRRFNKDCSWTTGNCYYFARILKDRFPDGEIYYDVIYGHFVFKYDNVFYDWCGVYLESARNYLISWDKFDEYDTLLRERIVRDCIM